MSLLDMLTGLVDGEVEFVLVGGFAANAHGSVRVTQDVDVCYDPGPENVRRLAGLLRSWNAYARGVEPGLPFVIDERTFRDVPVMTLVTDHGWLDVMDRVAGVGAYPEVRAASVIVELAGRRLRVLSLEGLIAAKRAAGRKKDRDQLPELEALLELKRKGGSRGGGSP